MACCHQQKGIDRESLVFFIMNFFINLIYVITSFFCMKNVDLKPLNFVRIFHSVILVSIFNYDFFFVSQDVIDWFKSYFREVQHEELIFYQILTSYLNYKLIALIEMAMPELKRRTKGKWRLVNVKYSILGSLKERTILVFQSVFKTKRMTSWYSQDL